ncbi:MAG: 50S ribosomal protein L25 [Parcubacteria group bacterium GW2011_GWA2_47_12]|nr:MAG: 50S ribosomal protein L25 [Parcubacteria group bacterium GW2011_GWA2_47_12]
MISLAYEKRDTKVKPHALRKGGKIPAVFYGRKRSATSIEVLEKAFEKAFAKSGENEVVTLHGAEGDVPALVYEVARHPVSGAVEHIDFYAFEAGQKLAVKVPIEFAGIAPAVKEKGGILVKVLRELHIEAEPTKLPHSISVDISPLIEFSSQITAKQIVLPEGVSLLEKQDEVVASVYEPKEEKIEEVAAPDLSQIEVVKKGKEPKDGEEEVAGTEEKAQTGGDKKEEKVASSATRRGGGKEGKKDEKKK